MVNQPQRAEVLSAEEIHFSLSEQKKRCFQCILVTRMYVHVIWMVIGVNGRSRDPQLYI
jgi:hypothetical protein